MASESQEGSPPKGAAARAYRDGEKIDPDDYSRDISLCPECSSRGKLVDAHTEVGNWQYQCFRRHHWMLGGSTGIVRANLLV